MKPIDRLLSFLAYKKISAYAFERACEVSNGYLYKQQKGKGTIGSDILEKIRKTYPELNLIWLIAGEGEMIIEREDNGRFIFEERERYELSGKISLLEALLSDKEKIIVMLEEKNAIKP